MRAMSVSGLRIGVKPLFAAMQSFTEDACTPACSGQWHRIPTHQLCPKQIELLGAGFALYRPVSALSA